MVKPRSTALRGVFAAGALALAACALPGPAQAMCGGNIFMTCAPSAGAATAEAARLKREKRLEAVRNRKHRYPLGQR